MSLLLTSDGRFQIQKRKHSCLTGSRGGPRAGPGAGFGGKVEVFGKRLDLFGVSQKGNQAGLHGVSGKQMLDSCLRLSQFDVYPRPQGVSGAHAETFKTALIWKGFFSIHLNSRIYILFLRLRRASDNPKHPKRRAITLLQQVILSDRARYWLHRPSVIEVSPKVSILPISPGLHPRLKA